LQFFSNDEEYLKGIDHYFDSFSNSTKKKFEKSATYFTDLKSPKRLKTFLPRAKVIAVLLEPAERAYSWYQHQVAHNDPAAISNSFYDILTSQPSDGDRWRLKMHCLQPGEYIDHLKRWFEYFGDGNVIILDGNLLKTDPIKVMNKLQIDLGLQLFYKDYSDIIEFKETKGYFCLKGKTEGTLGVCLGRGKGRDYPEMDQASKQFLADYYHDFNQERLQISVRRRPQMYPVPVRFIVLELLGSSKDPGSLYVASTKDLETFLLSTGKTLPSWLEKK